MRTNLVPAAPAGMGLCNRSGSSVKGVLFVLLALAVCFGYFYFFTDVLRSRSELAGQSDLYVSEIRKPLPERPGQSTGVPGTEGMIDQSSASQMEPSPPTAPGDAGTQSLPSVNKPAADAGVSKKKDGTVTSGGKQSIARNAESITTTPPSPEKSETKPVAPPSRATTQRESVTAAKKVSSAAPQSAASGKIGLPSQTVPEQSSRASGMFTLLVGTYVLKPTVLADKARLEKVGLRPEISEGKKTDQSMNRLLIADVSSHSVARAELQRVQKESTGAFMVKENDNYLVYAGSYFTAGRAVEEQKRLREKGFMPIVKTSAVPVSTYVLKVGRYASRQAAAKEASRLQDMGFKPLVVAAPVQ